MTTALGESVSPELPIDKHYFQSPETNAKGAQLFAAAHNVGLLDDLEKEELWQRLRPCVTVAWTSLDVSRRP